MVSLDFFTQNQFSSQTAAVSQKSNCETSAEQRGLKLLAKSACPVPGPEYPICLTSVYIEVLREVEGVSCLVRLTVCYVYSSSAIKEMRRENPTMAIQVIAGSDEDFKNYLTPLYTVGLGRSGGLLFNTSSLEDAVEDSVSFTFSLFPDGSTESGWTTVDTVVIGDVSISGNKVLSELHFDALGCDGGGEGGVGPIISDIYADCDGCFIVVENVVSTYGDRTSLRIYDSAGGIFDGPIFSSTQMKDPDAPYKIQVPCDRFADGGQIRVLPINSPTGIVAKFDIPPMRGLLEEVVKGAEPVVRVEWFPTPGKPCQYRITVELGTTAKGGFVMLVSGMTNAETADIRGFISRNIKVQSFFRFIRALGGVTPWVSRKVNGEDQSVYIKRWTELESDARVQRFLVDGPASFSVVVLSGEYCLFAVPVTLPGCLIDDRDGREKDWDRIEVDEQDESYRIQNSYEANPRITMRSPIQDELGVVDMEPIGIRDAFSLKRILSNG